MKKYAHFKMTTIDMLYNTLTECIQNQNLYYSEHRLKKEIYIIFFFLNVVDSISFRNVA